MSLKARLRLSILLLVMAVVITQSLLNLHHAAGENFADAAERAMIVAHQLKAYTLDRIAEPAEQKRIPTAASRQRRWYKIAGADPVLSHLIERTGVESVAIADVSIADADGTVLNSSNRRLIGSKLPGAIPMAEWLQRSTLSQLSSVFRGSEYYSISLPVGVIEQDKPALTVEVRTASRLLRASVEPQLKDLASLSSVLLCASIILAIVVSNLVARSVESIKNSVALISRGEVGRLREERFDSTDLAEVHRHLTRLGEQHAGFRQTIDSLRANVDGLLEGLEEATFVFGPDQRLQVAGAPAERLLAKKRSELAGKTFGELFPLWSELGQDAAARRPVRHRELTLQRGDLNPAPLIVDLDFMENGAMILRLRDAETRRQLRSELHLASHLTALSRLTSGVAHEMKNPLNAVLLHLGVLRTQLAGKEEAAGTAKIIEQELWRLDRVVKTFVDFNKPLELKLSDQDLGAIARDVVVLMQPEALLEGARLTLETHGPAPIEADPELLKHAILNVLSNAMEAAPGTEVLLKVEQAGDECQLSIRDRGPGIPPEYRDKVFQLYFTTKPDGSGLGLAMTFRLMQLHGGVVEFHCESGGTVFVLKLPARRQNQPSGTASQPLAAGAK